MDTRRQKSFFVVLVLAHLILTRNVSCSALKTMATDCKLGFGFDAITLVKAVKCMVKFYQDNPKMASEFKAVYFAAKHFAGKEAAKIAAGGTTAVAFVSSLYVASEAFDLYYRQLAGHLENVKEYKREIGILYRTKIVPFLRDVEEIIHKDKWEILLLRNMVSHLLTTLKEMTSTVTQFLHLIKLEKLHVIKNEGKTDAILKGSKVSCLVTAIASIAWPQTAVLGFLPSLFTFKTYKELQKSLAQQRGQLEELQNGLYEYKEALAMYETQLNRLLQVSYGHIIMDYLPVVVLVLFFSIIYLRR